MRSMRRATAAVLATALLLLPTSAHAAVTNAERAAWAAGFISSRQQTNGAIPSFSTVGSTADAVVALVAARRGPVNINKAMRFLARRVKAGDYGVPSVEEVGVKAKIVLAAVASGRNPRKFAEHNLVREITQTEQSDGRYGAGTAVFNHATAMLALVAAGASASDGAVDWLAGAQCDDGGWAYDDAQQAGDDEHCTDTGDPGNDYFPSDTNTTSLAVQALSRTGALAAPAHDPFAFFAAARDGENGWGYQLGGETDANSTGMVIQAHKAAGVALPTGAMRAMKALQYKFCGAFRYNWSWGNTPDVGATIAGVLGVLRRPLPVKPVRVRLAPPAPIGCPA